MIDPATTTTTAIIATVATVAAGVALGSAAAPAVEKAANFLGRRAGDVLFVAYSGLKGIGNGVVDSFRKGEDVDHLPPRGNDGKFQPAPAAS